MEMYQHEAQLSAAKSIRHQLAEAETSELAVCILLKQLPRMNRARKFFEVNDVTDEELTIARESLQTYKDKNSQTLIEYWNYFRNDLARNALERPLLIEFHLLEMNYMQYFSDEEMRQQELELYDKRIAKLDEALQSSRVAA